MNVCRLNLASLERGAEDGEGQMVRFVERCQCPYGYAGYSCEKCTEGFRRENNTLQGGLCLPCDCNGHSPMCDPFSGKCGVGFLIKNKRVNTLNIPFSLVNTTPKETLVKNASQASMVMPGRGRQIPAGVAPVHWNTQSPIISVHLVKRCLAIPTSTPAQIAPLVMKVHTAINALQVS